MRKRDKALARDSAKLRFEAARCLRLSADLPPGDDAKALRFFATELLEMADAASAVMVVAPDDEDPSG
jgi:hypothetical protein